MTGRWWGVTDGAAVSDCGDVARPTRRGGWGTWLRQLPASDVLWWWGDRPALAELAEELPDRRWSGRVGQGSLLALRPVGGPEARETWALLPWLTDDDFPEEGADRAAALVCRIRLETSRLEARGYAVLGRHGRPRLTIGSVAYATAARLCGRDRAPALEWAEYDAGRRAYHGGRVEVFRTRSEAVAGFDVRSAYPWALTLPVPIGARSVLRGIDARRAYLRGRPGAYWCETQTPDDNLPRLPFREPYDTPRGRARARALTWATGCLDGWWPLEELEAAEHHGASVVPHVAYVYETTDAVWSPYVAHAMRDRREAEELDDAPRVASAKLLANGLSGKLAQLPDSTTVCVLEEGADPRLGWHWHGGRVWSRPTRHVPASARPIEAACITGRVRARLLTALAGAPDRLYCDTDSLYRVHNCAPPDEPSAGLGAWRSTGVGHSWWAPSPKVYRYRTNDGREHVAAAGVPDATWRVLDDLARGRGRGNGPRLSSPRVTLDDYAGARRILADDSTEAPHRLPDGSYRRAPAARRRSSSAARWT